MTIEISSKLQNYLYIENGEIKQAKEGVAIPPASLRALRNQASRCYRDLMDEVNENDKKYRKKIMDVGNQKDEFYSIYASLTGNGKPLKSDLEDLELLIYPSQLLKNIKIINRKIHNYNVKLTSGIFGWFLSIFKINMIKTPELTILSTSDYENKSQLKMKEECEELKKNADAVDKFMILRGP